MALQESASFGEMVRRYRRGLGLTQEELAERAGLSERAVREIERGGKHTPRKETVRLLVHALELEGAERDAFEVAANRAQSLGGAREERADSAAVPVAPVPPVYVPNHAPPPPRWISRSTRHRLLHILATAILLAALVGGGSLVASQFVGGTAGRFVVVSKPSLHAVWGEPNAPSHFTDPILVAAGPGDAVYVGDWAGTILKLSPTGQLLQAWMLPSRTRLVESDLIYSYISTSIAALWTDRYGNVYVADSESNRVLKLSPDGATLAAWGRFGLNPGEFYGPSGGAVDAAGNVYVTEGGNDRVQKLSPTGKPLAVWGSLGTGPGQFKAPGGIAMDGEGDVYVLDGGNDRVQELSPDGKVMTVWGTYGSQPGQFDDPQGVTVDAQGQVYVADSGNHRIQEFSSTGQFLAQWGGKGRDRRLFGSPSLVGGMRPTWGDPRQYRSPSNVALDERGWIYVADPGRDSVEVLSSDGKLRARWPKSQLLRPLFQSPQYVACDTRGDIYVTDGDANRVVVLSPGGDVLRTWGMAGSGAGEFRHPSGIAVNADGDVYVADGGNDRIEEFSQAGKLLALWGAPGMTPGSFLQPKGLAVDGRGDVYVADDWRVQEFSADGHFLANWGYSYASAAYLGNPAGLVVDARGDLFAADSYRVVEFSPSRVPLRAWEPAGAAVDVSGVAVDPAGDVVLSDRRDAAIQVLSPAGKLLVRWGTEGSGPGQFRNPQGIAVDAAGNVSVADTGNNRVQTFSLVH